MLATLQQSDADFLFKNIETNKVAVLDTEEMKETKGNGLWSWLISIFKPTFCCTIKI